MYDNIVFGIRSGMLDLNQTKYESLCFPFWFAADIAMFTKTIIKMHTNYYERKVVRNNLLSVESLHNNLSNLNNFNRRMDDYKVRFFCFFCFFLYFFRILYVYVLNVYNRYYLDVAVFIQKLNK